MKARFLLALATGLAVTACDVAPSELDGLSPESAEAYVVLQDQLAYLFSEEPSGEVAARTLCVIVDDNNELTAAAFDQIVISRLQKHVPAAWNVTLMASYSCHMNSTGPTGPHGEKALTLSATRDLSKPGQWSAGLFCGPLCGRGNTYDIYYVFGYPFANRTGEFVS